MTSRAQENKDEPERPRPVYETQPLPAIPFTFYPRTDTRPTTSWCRTCIETDVNCDGEKPICGTCKEKGLYCRWSIILISGAHTAPAGEGDEIDEHEENAEEDEDEEDEGPDEEDEADEEVEEDKEVNEDEEDEDDDGDEGKAAFVARTEMRKPEASS